MPFAPLQAIDRAAARLTAALTDPARRERSVVWLLAAYALVWATYAAISKAPQGLHPDMTELVAWSRDPALGYFKHPPLAAWLVAGWFSFLPVDEWSYYLLAMLMPALALWLAWRLAADHLDADKRVAGLALLMLVPFFNFHALKFNVNTVLLPLWAATALAFLRSYRTRQPLWAALAGLAAAASMYGKYWSVFLLAGLALAALADKRRMDYFRSPAPWITVAVGALALAPHIYWLMQHDFAPFGYAVAVHGEKAVLTTLKSIVGYLAGSLAYVAVPAIVTVALVRARPAALADIAWPRDDERRLVALAFWLPLLMPVAGALAGRSEITSLWSMPAFALLPVLLLSSPQVELRPAGTRALLIAAVALPLIMLIASPLIAYIAHRNKPLPASAQGDVLARQVEQAWYQVTPAPLHFVGGNADLAYAVATYSAQRPRALTDMPPPPAAALARGGSVWVCFAEDAGCKAKASAQPGGRVIESTIVRGFMRTLGEPQRYTIVVVPPRP
ncbi:MAG: glycosyltransferase family 39 protein [Pseudolabrys sp.]